MDQALRGVGSGSTNFTVVEPRSCCLVELVARGKRSIATAITTCGLNAVVGTSTFGIGG